MSDAYRQYMNEHYDPEPACLRWSLSCPCCRRFLPKGAYRFVTVPDDSAEPQYSKGDVISITDCPRCGQLQTAYQ